MYHRMIRLHFEEDALDELVSFLGSREDRMSSIEGLESTDLVTTGSGEAMIIASWDSVSNYEKTSGQLNAILDEMRTRLTSTPHGHEGTVVYSYRA